ncbi:MAG: gamma-glutamyltransferase [Halanaerobiales bacterium]|nr:gamma-glutamyltransferase [Halanaerobiales bacterium]
MNFDYLNSPYLSNQNTKFAKNGMVATTQPLAAQAGLDILKKGGNAVDAAVATAACLTVVEPTSNGIGGDAFAIVYINEKMYGLNASGHSPKSISIKEVKKRGCKKMPKTGFIPVTVPGAPSAWSSLIKRFGNLKLTEVLKPAIEYAAEGYPVSPTVSKNWKNAFDIYKDKLDGKEFQSWFDTFTIEGKPPESGQIWKSKDHAETLKSIAETNADSFYKGKLADKIDAFFKEYDGFLSKDDLNSHSVKWVDPISVNYRGYDVWELPPNGQGLVALLALKILNGFDFSHKDTVETYHKQIEALKLAFADGKKYITDQDKMKVEIDEILADSYTDKRRNMIKETALKPAPGKLKSSGTVYLSTADKDGNMVSYIQSNYMGFGSGLVVPDTGIALQNRGHSFSLNKKDHNCLEPNKRTYHTIIPGFLTKDNKAVGPFGVMGGFMQPQGHLQVLMNLIDFNLNPQSALDAPRWQWIEDKKVLVESDFDYTIAKKLVQKGHDIEVALDSSSFGRGQIIIKNSKNNTYYGGTEKRADGHIAVY